MIYTLRSYNPHSLRALILGKIALPSVLLYRNIFKFHKTEWNENRERLQRFPDGSIGKELSEFLFQNSIDIEPKMESHDFYHVVLGYNTSLPEEAALHFFLIGNGKKSHYPFIAAIIGFVFFPEYYDLYIDAYHRGRCTMSFTHWNLRDQLGEDLTQFRKSVFLPQRMQ